MDSEGAVKTRYTIGHEITIDLSCLAGEEWNIPAGEIREGQEAIKQAAAFAERIRETGQGADGSSVLFQHLPYILDENLLMDEEEKEHLRSLAE